MNIRNGLWLLAIGLLAACGGGGGGGSSTGPSSSAPAMYSVSVTVTGLAGTGLVLQNNGAGDLAVSANGTSTFAAQVANGGAYAVTVKTQPSAPTQTCSVSGSTGTVTANVTNVAVTCAINTYPVSVTISGLNGTGLVLQNNGSSDLNVSANGTATFATQIASGGAYNVTVKTQPTPPSVQQQTQICDLSNASGVVGSSAVNNVTVNCRAGIGKFLYATSPGGNNISAFSINPSTGVLTAVPGSPFQAGPTPRSAIVDRDGAYFYVVNSGTGTAATLSAFAINNTSGSLTEIVGSPYPAGVSNLAGSVVLHPSKKFLYVSNYSDGKWFGYAINANGGQLTSISGSPYTVGLNTQGGAFDSVGQYFYVPYGGATTTSGGMSVYSVNATTGELTLSSSVSFSGSNPLTATLVNSGKFLYLNYLSSPSRWLAAYTVNSVTGALTVIPNSPYMLNSDTTGGSLPHSSGKFIYIGNRGSASATGSILAFNVDQVSGQLTPILGSPFSTFGNNVVGFAMFPGGAYLTAVHSSSATVSIFQINGATGGLALATPAPIPTPGTSPGALRIDPSGKFAYLPDTAAAVISVFSIDATSGLITLVGTYPTAGIGPIVSVAGLQ